MGTILINLGRLVKALTLVVLLVPWLDGCQKEVPVEKVLFDFEEEVDLDKIHWKCRTLFSLSEEHATHGERCLRMELYPSLYPGVIPMLKYHDWSRFRSLRFDVYNPEEKEINLSVRIDDDKKSPDYADRYNKTFVLGSGYSQVEIPFESLVTTGANRQLDLRTIYRLVIFVQNVEAKTDLYLDYIKLVA
jgi:hypothetical protein